MKKTRLSLSQTTNFRLFQTDENGKKFPKHVENTVGKGEIARYEYFLLFQQCFKILVLQTRKKQGLFGTGITKIASSVVCKCIQPGQV